MTSNSTRAFATAALAACLAAVPAAAHHSFAMFDATKPLQLRGTVKIIQWAAPHVVLWVDADEVGRYSAGQWTLELPTSPGNLSKMGWSRHSLKPGDQVLVDVNPIRDGRRSGQFKKATLVATGKVFAATSIPGSGPQPPK